MKMKYTCRDYRATIVPFIEGELSDQEKLALIGHAGNCNECQDELRVQFLVREGLKRLEKGGNFDLKNEFETFLKENRKESLGRIHLRRASLVLGTLFYLGSLALLVMGVMAK